MAYLSNETINRKPYVTEERPTQESDYPREQSLIFKDISDSLEVATISSIATQDTLNVEGYKIRQEASFGTSDHDNNYDYTMWSGLPSGYDKRTGHVTWRSVTQIERNKHTKEEVTKNKMMPVYDKYLPALPTPIIYTNWKGADNIGKQVEAQYVHHVEGTLTDVTYQSITQKLNYHITLDLSNKAEIKTSEVKLRLIRADYTPVELTGLSSIVVYLDN